MAELVDSADVVFHLAAAVGVQLIDESPVRTIETNAALHRDCPRPASKKKEARIHRVDQRGVREKLRSPLSRGRTSHPGATTKGRWSYACSKAIDEFLAIAHWKSGNCRLSSAAPSTPLDRDRPVATGWWFRLPVARKLADRLLLAPWRWNTTPLLCHVADAVRALADLMRREDVYGEVFNIGAYSEIEIRKLAERVVELTGSPAGDHAGPV